MSMGMDLIQPDPRYLKQYGALRYGYVMLARFDNL